MPLRCRVSVREDWKSRRCTIASTGRIPVLRPSTTTTMGTGMAPTMKFGRARCQSSPTNACCEVVRVIGDLRLDPVTIE